MLFIKKLFKINEISKYKILTAIRYLGDSFFYPFFALYLESTGMIEKDIGFILSIAPILSIVCNPIYSYLCKDINKTRKVLEIITILEGIFIAIVAFSSNFYLVTILTILIAIFGSCHYGLLDSITSFFANSNNINYSGIRIFGSSAYIIGTTLGGIITKYINYQSCFIFACIFFILSGLFYFLLMPFDNPEVKDTKVNTKETIKYLFRNKKYVFFIIFYCLLYGTQYSSGSFYSLYLSSRGITSSQYGLIYSYFVIFEVVTLFILNKKLKSDNKNINKPLLLISSILLFIRLLVNYLDLNIYIVIFISCLRGIGYAFILHTAFTYVQLIVKKESASLAIMILTLFYSIYVAIWNNVNGMLIDKYSYKTFHLVNAILALVAIILAIIRLFFKEDSKNEY